MKIGHLMRLRTTSGKIYLDRYGFASSLFGIYVHRMDTPDPGLDVHDHPFGFVSIVLRGGYVEERCPALYAPAFAKMADRAGPDAHRGGERVRPALSVARFGLDECHRITRLLAPRVWTIVLRGPVRVDRDRERSTWGFWTAGGWIDERTYDETIRADRRDLWNEVGT